jgi:3-oxoacyl-[acyl-carrier-protein] synthase-3
MTPFRIAGWGAYRPRTTRPSRELDEAFGKEPGWTEREFGIAARGIAAPDETSSMMGAEAARRALTRTGWDGFDVLIGACGVMEQPIPSTSVLIQDRLGLGSSGIPAFDINQTCLSFLTALDIAAMGISAGRWQRALIVSSDIASAGLDPAAHQISSIFGDGAAAIALEKVSPAEDRGLMSSGFESYGKGHQLATLRAGGTRLRVTQGYEALVAGSYFQMDAFGIFKAAARCLPRLIDRVLDQAGQSRDTIDLVVCHQASAPGVEHVRRLFAPNSARVVDIFPTTGNQIAASIPSVLAHVLEQGLAARGSNVLLLGTAAGISAGAGVLRL